MDWINDENCPPPTPTSPDHSGPGEAPPASSRRSGLCPPAGSGGRPDRAGGRLADDSGPRLGGVAMDRSSAGGEK